MASSPGFDPNLIEKPPGYAKIQATKSPCPPEPASPLLNRATQGLFPPGSTFKTVTAAAALDDGVYTPDSTFDDPGYCTEYGKKVYERARPERARRRSATSTSSRPTSTRSTRCSATSARSSARSGSSSEAKKFGFYSTPPLETPSRRALGLGPLRRSGKLFDPKDTASRRSTRAASPSGRRRC